MAISLKWTVTPTYTSTKCTIKVTLKAVSTYGSWAASASGSISIGGTSYSFSHGYSANTTTTLATKSKTISLTTSKQTIKIAASFATGTSSGTVKKSDTITIAARPTYTVTFNANGGTKTSKVTVLDEATTKFPSAGTRTGYKMLGWSTSSSASSATWVVGGTTPQITSSRTYYAVWQRISYTATFNVNGGSGSVSSGSSYYNATYTFPTTRPTKSGYLFVGWSLNSGAAAASYVPGKSIKWSWEKNQTFYAIYIEDDINPIIEDLSIKRATYNSSTSSYVQDDQSENVYVSFDWVSGATSSGYSNSTTINVSVDGTSVYSTNASSSSGEVGVLLGDSYPLDDEFEVTVRVTDNVNSNYTEEKSSIPKGGYTIAISANGKAVALFGTADDEDPGFSLYNNKVKMDNGGNLALEGKVSAVNLTGTETEPYTGSYKCGNAFLLSGALACTHSATTRAEDFSVIYGVTFKYRPNVQITNMNIPGNYHAHFSIAGQTKNGFTIRIYSNQGASHTYTVGWLAIGELA